MGDIADDMIRDGLDELAQGGWCEGCKRWVGFSDLYETGRCCIEREERENDARNKRRKLMKRETAAKRIRTHRKDFEKRLAKDGAAELGIYWDRTGQPCPLCAATGDRCSHCLKWPHPTSPFPCANFIRHVNKLKTRAAKLKQIAKLEKALDEWVRKEAQNGDQTLRADGTQR